MEQVQAVCRFSCFCSLDIDWTSYRRLLHEVRRACLDSQIALLEYEKRFFRNYVQGGGVSTYDGIAGESSGRGYCYDSDNSVK